MIKANELRIGNLVFDNEDRLDNTIFTVSRVELPEYTDWNDGDGYSVTASKGDSNNYYSLKPAGIPLNEEWLVKFGFEKEEADAKGIAVWDEFYHGTFLISNHGTGIEDYHFIAYEGEVVDVRFVHELQNLFFAIKGEELTIKEKVA
jgi:hypothetical protein